MEVSTNEEVRIGTSEAAPALEETRVPEITAPKVVKIPEAGPTSPCGGLHEVGDPSTDETWHATTSADVPAPTAMTTGDEQAVQRELRL
jgi:hypothetical protein